MWPSSQLRVAGADAMAKLQSLVKPDDTKDCSHLAEHLTTKSPEV